jgi:hypothetical protein
LTAGPRSSVAALVDGRSAALTSIVVFDTCDLREYAPSLAPSDRAALQILYGTRHGLSLWNHPSGACGETVPFCTFHTCRPWVEPPVLAWCDVSSRSVRRDVFEVRAILFRNRRRFS